MRRVVVTGLGAVSPVGLDVASTWNSLISGRHGIAKITRFDTEGFKATLAAEVKDFDPTLYMDKSEVRRSDLFTQFALAAAVQAVKDSGIEGTIAPERLGVYSGSGVGGLITISNEIEKLITKGPKKVSPLFIPMMIANIATGTIAIRFNAKGPSLPVVTACATSTNAVGEAYRAILHGYADAIIAGGSEATITPIGIAGFTNCMALTTSDDPDCASIPFDRRRNGFLMGEGAGMLILEEYERAKARGAKIYAELVGYSSTNDAYHITAPAPDGESAALAIAQTFEQAKGERAQCIYINAHGTSTP
ncbi:MAG: beta-ketoacyl-ACP synthase II, partial [Clostridia bacterium]|nr:beta-ketoacyl-ACP synthase II [Clostridia bacterium]